MDISGLSGSYHPELLEEVEEGKTAAATETTDLTEATEEKAPNLSKDPELAHILYGSDGDNSRTPYTTYRKHSGQVASNPVRLPGNSKHQFYRSRPKLREMPNFVKEPTPGMRSYRLAENQVVKMLSWGKGIGGEEYPLAAGTSRPGVVCVTDGMAVCTAVVIGARTADKRQAKIKVFHIHPDMNTKALEAIDSHIQNLKHMGFTEFTGALHGGNYYKPEETAKVEREKRIHSDLRNMFDTHNIPLELDEAGEKRAEKNTALGAVIEPTGSGEVTVRIINEIVAPPKA